ncbi:hypothetical protein PHYSODRAFT_330058 [Phytophthora sojae]|uniref:Uncharacterized protein n=1 Tax=Phytophthora sojae (strain P6497) TaxID=1094619 RepID=G4Z432_PHYSP|nr:hypothetical protein PHYSODRAFT_330058 [Phytophthora sojae]EGZ22226.1 hypothetical protein PHYSODRAFT_330058 [Phytophthora sojae]|eukprot:XP_009524943.1 hypothetical protein PHYSODRAFT_330058 [Phytophthora sojae]
MMVLTATWKFPTPFGYILIIGPYVAFFSFFTVLVIGPRKVLSSLALREELKSEFFIISSQGVVAGCFAIFSAVFNRLSGIQQTAFIFVMPMIKFLTKQNIANAAERFHEYMALIVVFSVDLFNVYYVAICMQSSKSVGTTLIKSPIFEEIDEAEEKRVVEDSLQALFHAEYILLAEYIEFTIPLFYAPYLVAIFHLPVGAFYPPHTAATTASKLGETVTSILIYSAVEFVAFGALLVLLRRKFGLHPLYQLAFVLETHAPAIQGQLFLWTITILHLTLQHYGVDFNILTT